MTVLMREGAYGGCAWRQLFVITDRRVAIVEMTPALLGGWCLGRVTIQGADDWSMDESAIVAWKMAGDDGRTTVLREFHPPEFRTKLLAHVGAEG